MEHATISEADLAEGYDLLMERITANCIIETLYCPTPFSKQWITDAIGENEPRTREECMSDVLAFRRGECGPAMANGFAAQMEGMLWRIVEVSA